MCETRAFPDTEFDVTLSSTSIAECEELLQDTLEEALSVTRATRGFLALVDMESGELVARFTSGEGWNAEKKRLRLRLEHPEQEWTGEQRGITGYVAQTGKPYLANEVDGDPHYIRYFDDVRSELAVPILEPSGGRTLGVLNLESTEVATFNEEHVQLLVKLANRAAIAISMVEHQVREEALIEIGKELGSTADIDQLIHSVIGRACRILRADDGSLFLWDEDTHTLSLAASHGPLGAQAGQQETTYHLGEGLTGWVAERRKPIRIGDPRNDPRWKGLTSELPRSELGAFLAVPILGQRGLIGVLRMVRRRKRAFAYLPVEFTQAGEDVLTTLASQLAVAIDKAHLLDRLLQAERMAAWGELSARSAHMIGNAVFALKGTVNEVRHALEQASPDVKEALGQIDRLTRGIYRLEEILREYRDFVMATQVSLEERDLNQLLREAMSESFPKGTAVELQMHLDEGLPPVRVDAGKLKRCFAEIIENAIDFQPQGGVLSVSSRLASEEAIKTYVRSRRAQGYICIEFADQGPGLPPEDKERIFNPFFSHRAKGMGLGLSIVKGIIDAHRGVIREVGVAGRGARFIILLPGKDDG